MVMIVKKDISDISDIEWLVNAFYTEVRNDGLLAPVFNAVIQDRWPAHLEKMVKFWETVLLDGQGYFGKPFVPHATLPVNHEHFDRWVYLFEQTVDANFSGAKAEEAKWRGSKMAVLFLSKIRYISNNPGKVILL
jgi:hemoglobin